ncbi:MAG: hypothetical protein M1817_004831 [Caeruleum heppii]|nr:MAG: hypothetical protein M1817_004831 [Caeruleum heppii]
MGLGAFKTAWHRQTKDFGHDKGDQYSSLILDNRGMGESEKPLTRYSTTEMAKDVIEVLDHVGWTSPRELHIVGISMGGMIAQELGLLIPDRIASLSLISTAPRLGFIENLRNRINLFLPKSIDAQLTVSKYNLFPAPWLLQPDAEATPEGGWPTNGDRFAAQELRKRRDLQGFTRKGFILQAIAAGWHHKTPAQLKELGDKVGRNRIQVVHGKLDRMITAPHADMLAEELNAMGSGLDQETVRRSVFDGSGHVLPMEKRAEFGRLIEEMVVQTEGLGKEV